MPTSTEQIAELIRSNTELKSYFERVRGDIDRKVADADKRVDGFIAEAKGIIPLPQNLVANPFMDNVTNGVPTGYAASGLTLSADHPYTKAFEGPYTQTEPINSTSEPKAATKSNPYWYGKYNKGPRFPRWCGGLASGWYAMSNGHILRIEAKASEPTHNRQLFLPRTRRVYADKYFFKFWAHLEKGSLLYVGAHAGYRESKGGMTITRAQFEAEPQGWKLIQGVVSINAMMSTFGNGFCIGFRSDEHVVARIAMPQVHAFMYPSNIANCFGE